MFEGKPTDIAINIVGFMLGIITHFIILQTHVEGNQVNGT